MPWSRTSATSFLVADDEMRALLLADGLFEVISWSDKTADALAWAASQPSPGSPSTVEPTVTLAQVIGPEAPLMIRNFTAGLKSGRQPLGVQAARASHQLDHRPAVFARTHAWVASVILFAMLAGCATPRVAPVIEVPHRFTATPASASSDEALTVRWWALGGPDAQ